LTAEPGGDLVAWGLEPRGEQVVELGDHAAVDAADLCCEQVVVGLELLDASTVLVPSTPSTPSSLGPNVPSS
jgi:hypothetical protein